MRLRRLLRHPGSAVLVMVLAAYAYFYQAGGWNQNSRFALVRALVEKGTAAVDGYHVASWDLSCKGPDGICANRKRPDPARGEHFYCDKAPGAQLLAVPLYAVIHAVAGSERPTRRYLDWSSHLVTVWTVAVPSALAVLLLFLLLEGFGIPPGRRAAAALAYGLGSLAFPYATLYYGHQLAAALLLIGFALLVRARRLDRPLGAPGLVAVGAVLGTAVAVEYPSALGALPIAVYAALFVRPWPRLGWLVLGGLIPGLVTAGYHWIVFGGPTVLPYDFSVQDNRSQGWFMGLGVPAGEALWHILFSGYRGIFYSAPWLLLSAPGAYLLARRGYLAEVGVCVAVFLLYVILNGSLVDWSGGWALSARYLVPALPFLAILAAGVLLGRHRAWLAVWMLGAAAALWAGYLMLVGTAVKPEVPDVYVEPPRKVVEIRRPFGDFLLPSFGAGELAINSQGIDQAGVGRRGKRFLGEPRAFNLGQKLGLGGRASLIPLLAIWLGGAIWLIWAVRRRESASDAGAG